MGGSGRAEQGEGETPTRGPATNPAQEPPRAGSAPVPGEYLGAHAPIWGMNHPDRAGLPHPLSLPGPPALP